MTKETNPPPESNLMVKLWDFFNAAKPRVNESESTPLLSKTSDTKQKTINYLAYGSNLSASTFKGRRGIRPLSATNVLCPGQVLVFDLDGIPYWEPCFANIGEVSQEEQAKLRDRIAAAGSPEKLVEQYMLELEQLAAIGDGQVWRDAVIGVVYEVTEGDYATIIKTEGGGTGYKDVEVDCFVLPNVDEKEKSGPVSTIRAHTLRAPPGKNSSHVAPQPSLRYLNLLVAGAKEHSLPPVYIDYLSSLHGYHRNTIGKKIGGFLFLLNWMLPLAILFKVKNMVVDTKTGRSPTWMNRLEAGFLCTLWFTYRAFYRPIWGDGQRTDGDEVGMIVGEVRANSFSQNQVVDTVDLGDALADAEGRVMEAVKVDGTRLSANK